MFNETDAPPINDNDLAVSIALTEEREEARTAWLTATQEEEDHAEAVRAWVAASAFIEEADAQQDLRWACKG
jgi:hypothetical protein